MVMGNGRVRLVNWSSPTEMMTVGLGRIGAGVQVLPTALEVVEDGSSDEVDVSVAGSEVDDSDGKSVVEVITEVEVSVVETSEETSVEETSGEEELLASAVTVTTGVAAVTVTVVAVMPEKHWQADQYAVASAQALA